MERSTTAFTLFCKHPGAKQFIEKNPQILNQCFTETAHYITEHFDSPEQDAMLESLHQRVTKMSKQINKTLHIKEVREVGHKTALQNTYYVHQVESMTEGRKHHAFQANARSLHPDSEFRDLKGDYLKSRILSSFKEEIGKSRPVISPWPVPANSQIYQGLRQHGF